jgi:hypothetical protein
MDLTNIKAGTQVVTSSGDVVEVLEVLDGGASARVRFSDPTSSSPQAQGAELDLGADDIMTLAGDRFVGPT